MHAQCRHESAKHVCVPKQHLYDMKCVCTCMCLLSVSLTIHTHVALCTVYCILTLHVTNWPMVHWNYLCSPLLSFQTCLRRHARKETNGATAIDVWKTALLYRGLCFYQGKRGSGLLCWCWEVANCLCPLVREGPSVLVVLFFPRGLIHQSHVGSFLFVVLSFMWHGSFV